MNRKDLEAEIKAKRKEYKILEKEFLIAKRKLIKQVNKLIVKSYLLNDKKQNYTEEWEVKVISNRPKKTEDILVGRINFHEYFKDMDTGKRIRISRSQVVRVNNKWRF